jgi:hypothetical protein
MSVFEAVEAGELKPLPRNRFVLATWSTGTIGPDIHVRVGKSLYSVPWRHMGRRVDARETPTVVQIFDAGELIATHGRRPAGKSTDLSHYPPEKIAFTMRTPTWCRSQAADIGPSCAALIAALLEVNALFRLRAAQGVLGLTGKHDPARVEKACARAIEVGDPSYRTVKGILAAGTEADPPPEPTGDGGAAAHLHGPSQLFGNVVALPTPNPTPAGEHATTSVGHDTGAHDGRGDRNTPPAPTEPGRSGSGRGTDSEEAS